MRARFRSLEGTGLLELPDTATVQDVFDEITSKTGYTRFILKYGSPVNMRSLDISSSTATVQSLRLHGETLTVVPAAESDVPAVHDVARQASIRDIAPRSPEEALIRWPERGGCLLLRVMPSDNSCLFSAFGGALAKQLRTGQLREMMADHIAGHPETYTEAILGCPPEQYCRGILQPDRWGGGIELSILSTIFDIQICTFNVQTLDMITFGEGKPDRCMLVYSGIHYDRVAFSPCEAPHDSSSLPPELDCTLWSTDDTQALEKAQDLLHLLHAAHYYTDTAGLVLKCDVAGCDWIGMGQREGQKHAELTGHVDLCEMLDTMAGSS